MPVREPVFAAILMICGVTVLGAGSGDRAAEERARRLDTTIRGVVGVDPAPPMDDASFLRRVTIDLTGRFPSPLEIGPFLDDPHPDKRARLVDRLLASDEFAEHWGRVLAFWLTDERPIARDPYDGRVLAEYLGDSLQRGTPYPVIARELITGTGLSDRSGPANLLLRYEADPIKLAGGVGKNLLGVTIQCAQCHNHPFARWEQDDFWGLAAVFARVRRMDSTQGEPLRALLEARRGELTRPDPGAAPKPNPAEGEEPEPLALKVVRPRLLDGTPIPAQHDRRQALADWMTSEANPYLTRNLINRVWGELFGRTLARNLDDGAAHAEALPVLDRLAADFAESAHDLRPLLRTILLTEAYGQVAGKGSTASWARPAVRPLSVDALYAAITQATGHDIDDPAADEDSETGGEAGDPAESGQMTQDDFDPQNPQVGDRPVEQLGERAWSLQRSLILMNGGFLHDAVRSAGRVARALHGPKLGPAHVRWAFLSTVSRPPQDDELALMLGLMRRTPQRGLEDVYWVLLNSAEFQSQH